jgi:hypothetical protein
MTPSGSSTCSPPPDAALEPLLAHDSMASQVDGSIPESPIAVFPTPGQLPRWVTRIALPILAFAFLLYNAFLLTIMIAIHPKNDFGRTFESAKAFMRGEPLYGMNDSIPWNITNGKNLGVHATVDLWNLNPPHFHLLLVPLTFLSDRWALIIWCLINGACFIWSVRLIAAEAGLQLTLEQRHLALFFLLAFIGTGSALVTGHLSFLLLLLVTLVWRDARHDRWLRAGLYLGLGLSVKPFLLMLVPYLAWRRQWGALAVATGVTAGCFAAGWLAFGPANHTAWFNMLDQANQWSWLPMNASIHGMLTRTFSDNVYFAPLAELSKSGVTLWWLALGVPIGVVTLWAASRDASTRGLDRAFAVLLVAALMLSPLGWTYYFWLPVGPAVACFMPRGRLAGGTPSVRRLLLFSAPGFMYPILLIEWGQPSPIATLALTNIYLASLLCVWAALLVDAFRPSGAAVTVRSSCS